MKAIVTTKYGAPEVLQMKEVEKPVPGEKEILIKIHATSVSSGDARMRRADPFMIRLIFGFSKPKKSIPGVVVAGEIEAVGSSVSRFKSGDQVFGSVGMAFGAHADYVAVPEDAVLALKPSTISYEEAAAIPFGGTAAMHFLRLANIQAGHKVLVYGASGALGTIGIQLARNFGAEVTAVCSSANYELVKSLGADKVIDYTKEDFTRNREHYDVVFDTLGKSPLGKTLKSLKKGGQVLLANAGMGTMISGAFRSALGKKKIVSGVIKETSEDMNYFKQLIEEGKLKAVIDRIYTLKQISEAHAYVDKGHKKGNVIIAINHSA
ncbi:MAG: NAD(P)-dependent alcohol dehydrogenase [Bacteroidales bacterium]